MAAQGSAVSGDRATRPAGSAPALEWTPVVAPADEYDEPALSLVHRYVETANRVTQHFCGDEALDTTDDDILASLLHRADALAHAGERYEVVSWQGATPPELREAMATLHERMVTDAPSAGLDVDDERWDAARLERTEAEWAEAGQTALQAAALERASGAAVAFTVLLLPEAGRPAFQEDTLVHGDHRGHRLGMLVKAENLLQLRRLHPDRSRVLTWNATENRHMLAVNEALGFAPVGAEGGWQRRLVPFEPPAS